MDTLEAIHTRRSIRKFENGKGMTDFLAEKRVENRSRRTESPSTFDLDRCESLMVLIHERVE